MRVRRHLTAAVLAPLLVLAACGEGDPEPKIAEPSATPTPTSTESPTAAQESPEDFIRRWAAAEAEMQNTGKTDEYLTLTRDCDACSGLAAQVEEFYEAGGFIRWDGWDIERVIRQGKPGRIHSFRVEFVSAPTRYKEAKSAPVQSLPGGPSQYLIEVSKAGSTWVVISKSELNT